jgi:hypothetical protein
MHVDALAELVLKRVEDIVRVSFSMQYVILQYVYFTFEVFLLG